MKRKLALVRALVHSPELVILDEPTAGLDAASKYSMRSLVNCARSTSCTFLIATQDLWEAERIATGITILRNGEVMYTGSYAELCAQTPLRKFRLGCGVELERLWAYVSADSEVVRQEEDCLGATVLVHVGKKATCLDRHSGLGALSGGVVELPLSLEEAYLEMDRLGRDSDDW